MKNDAWRQIKLMNAASDFVEYLNEYNENVHILRNYSRDRAILRLQQMIDKYTIDINILGLFNGVQVVRGVDYNKITDYTIATQLNYINECIPIFALMRKGFEELAIRCFANLVNNLFGGEGR